MRVQSRAEGREDASEYRGTSGALYRQVMQKLLARSIPESWALAIRYPRSRTLAAQFSVSRHTMREALRILRELGVIDRRPGAGTVIKARRPQRSYVQVINSPRSSCNIPRAV